MSADDRERADPVRFEDRLTIATPEGVEVELTLAGIGSRFIAAAVDFLIQSALAGGLAVILSSAGDVGAVVYPLAIFAIVFLYDVSFEVLARGKTPGKAWNDLRVVRSGGRPITLVRSAIRNVLRIVDVLPIFYAVGMAVIFATRRNQRIGDLVAGTYVVRERSGDRRARRRRAAPHVDPGPATAWDLSAVSTADTAAITAFLERRSDLADPSRAAIAGELARRLRPRVAGAPEDIKDEEFLELLAAAKAARGG
jgi:uncharacterized RDD family membrane protein YckC